MKKAIIGALTPIFRAVLVGPRVGRAEAELEARGCELIRSEYLSSHWFNQATRSCAAITTVDWRSSNRNTIRTEANDLL